ncbi:MAG TPA: amidohydrolase/deacetylase family metallohydrolase [Methylomirabilota bacterium]|nr:amidohydrolase/deacetylase family metallohydrolase [Methylomirabilota bacterium]
MGLLLKGGEVLDPGAGLAGALDVRLRDGRVAEVGAALAPDGDRVEDVRGRLVVPGLIDLHAHCFLGAVDFGPRTDEVMARAGVTTMVDGGSAGAALVEGMRRWVVERARVRILAFLHISAIGLAWMRIGEVHHLAYADVDAAVGAAREHADLVVGIKVRQEAVVVGEAGLEPLRRAVRAAEAVGTRVMVHVTTPPVPLADLLALLRPGDVVTHFLHGRGDGILDAHGQVKKEVWAARERGIVLDVGHGRRHLNFDVARAAFRQGLAPDTISSDLNTPAAAGVAKDLPTTMAKFLGLGMPLPDVVRAVTAAPAAVLGRAGELGTLRPGAAGDVTVLDHERGAFDLEDNDGQRLAGRERLVPALTVKDGEVWWRRP